MDKVPHTRQAYLSHIKLLLSIDYSVPEDIGNERSLF